MFADVLILRPESGYDQILTYLVPEGWDKAVPGILVAVQVKNKSEKGIVLRLFAERPKISKLQPLREILADEPLLSGKALMIARWLSEYYLCSLNKVIHLFLPPPVRQKETERITANPNETGEHILLGKLERDIYLAVKNYTRKNLTRKQIIKKFGSEAKNALEFLIKNGLLQSNKEFVVQDSGRKKLQIELTSLAPRWQDIVKKAPKQAQILRALENGPATAEELRGTNVLSGAIIKTIKNKGWISITETIQLRSPITGLMKAQRPDNLNTEQTYAAEKICMSIQNRKAKKWLLYGVTGSGKTEVYLKAIEETLKKERQVLYLVPEISLTPQITSLLIENFGLKIAILHSALSHGERYDEWMRINKGEAKVVLGPRSAVFAPFYDLGLIIIDEEHENTFKQNEPDPRYDARTVADKAAEIYKAVLVKGSATPSLQTCFQVKKREYELLQLSQRVAARPLPDIRVVDMRKEAIQGSRGLFSNYLQESLRKVFQAGEQAILFINRRGFHTFTICRECGLTLNCPRCSISMTYHRAQGRLVCHYCNYERNVPQKCPSCGSRFLQYYGSGTERVAEEFEKIFPHIAYTRVDTDTTQRKGSHFLLLKDFEQGKSQVLIGTQMIAKGLNFPEVTLVGIINPDVLINMPDYQSSERAYQLITQVAGRAGRGQKRGEVVIQSYDPGHYVFSSVIEQKHWRYISQEMENRMLLKYPPFYSIIRILVSGTQEKKVLDRQEYLNKIFKMEIEKNNAEIEIYGPAPAPILYLKGRYRYHLLLKGKDLFKLQKLVKALIEEIKELNPEPRVIIDVEPQNLM